MRFNLILLALLTGCGLAGDPCGEAELKKALRSIDKGATLNKYEWALVEVELKPQFDRLCQKADLGI